MPWPTEHPLGFLQGRHPGGPLIKRVAGDSTGAPGVSRRKDACRRAYVRSARLPWIHGWMPWMLTMDCHGPWGCQLGSGCGVVGQLSGREGPI